MKQSGFQKIPFKKAAPVSTIIQGSLNFLGTDDDKFTWCFHKFHTIAEAMEMDTQTDDASELGKYSEKCVQTLFWDDVLSQTN